MSSSQREHTLGERGGRGEGVLENEQGRTKGKGSQNLGILSERTL